MGTVVFRGRKSAETGYGQVLGLLGRFQNDKMVAITVLADGQNTIEVEVEKSNTSFWAAVSKLPSVKEVAF